jgi:hypothetical protein
MSRYASNAQGLAAAAMLDLIARKEKAATRKALNKNHLL